jgi:hypothetical protein
MRVAICLFGRRVRPASEAGARELGPVVYIDGDEIWNTEEMTTDEEWIAFARFLRSHSSAETAVLAADTLLPRCHALGLQVVRSLNILVRSWTKGERDG